MIWLRGLRPLSTAAPPIQTVAVIGFGQMGQGIAQCCASAPASMKVRIFDPNKKTLICGLEKLKERLGQDPSATTGSDVGESYACQDINSRIFPCEDVDDVLKGADLVIEAIVENMAAKQDLLAAVSKSLSLSPNTIISSNTSSLSIEKLSQSLSRGKKLYGLHFFNPVQKMKLVEIIAPETKKKSPDPQLALLTQFIKSLGKEPVFCKDSPGFIVNKLLIPYFMEAVRLYENNIASKEDIDKAMKLGAGYPMGPFALMDLIGLDTIKSIVDGWALVDSKNPPLQPSTLLESLIKQNKLGRKTGEGFYSYPRSKA